jgi:hypothetical protein
MALGIALLLIFILYLIDKHDRWRQAVKLTIGLVVLGLLGIVGVYGWQKYDEYRTEEQQAAYRTKMQPVWDCAARNSQFSNAEEECKKDPTVVLHPIQPTGFDPTAPYQSASPPPRLKIRSVLGSAVVTGAFTSMYKRCYFNTGSYPCGFDNYLSDGDVVATLHKGDRVQVLSRKTRSSGGSEIYEVQFQQWSGWIDATDISLE